LLGAQALQSFRQSLHDGLSHRLAGRLRHLAGKLMRTSEPCGHLARAEDSGGIPDFSLVDDGSIGIFQDRHGSREPVDRSDGAS